MEASEMAECCLQNRAVDGQFQSASLSDVNCDESESVAMQGANDETLYGNSSPENKPKLRISSLNRK